MPRIVVIRHGETEWNSMARYQGHTDIELSETGRKQAKMLSDRLQSWPISAVYSSDLVRAKETAEIVAANHDLPVEILQDLRETNFGHWEGLTYKEINEKYPSELEAWLNKPEASRIPGGELLIEVVERIERGFTQIIKQHDNDEVVAIFGHGGTARLLICSSLGIPINFYWQIRQDNTALNIIDIHGDKRIVSLLNDTSHLSLLPPSVAYSGANFLKASSDLKNK